MSRVMSLFTPAGMLGMLCRLPAILIGLSFHEWAHAFAAYKLGDPTARNMGRMTVNPLKHIDPIGFLTLILAGFGWAKPVPFSNRNFKKPRRDEILVSLAGITLNLLMAFVFMGVWLAVIEIAGYSASDIFMLMRLDPADAIYYVGTTTYAVNMMMFNMLIINIGLFAFNLLPIPPLDGYRVAMCLLPRKFAFKIYYYTERYGRIALFAVLLGLNMLGVLDMILGPLVYGVYNGMTGIYSLFGISIPFGLS